MVGFAWIEILGFFRRKGMITNSVFPTEFRGATQQTKRN